MLSYSIVISSLFDLPKLKETIERNFMEKPNFSELAREFNVSRDTVRRYYNGQLPKHKRKRHSKLENFDKEIKMLLNDEHKVFKYKTSLYRYLENKHGTLPFTQSTFNRYIKNNFKNEFRENQSYNGRRFDTDLGEQVQFDYKENQKYIDENGNAIITDIATLVLSNSRYNTSKVIPDKTTESTIAFMAETFDEWGVVPKEIVIDNATSLVNKSRKTNGEAFLNNKFEQFLKDYGIEVYVCWPNRPQTKGKVEKQMDYLDDLKGYNGEYYDASSINNILQNIIDKKNNSICLATGIPPIWQFNIEKERMLSLPSEAIRSKYYLKMKPVKVDKHCLFNYKQNKYSVPQRYIGTYINIVVTNKKLHVYYNENYICSHKISVEKINYLDAHLKSYSNNDTKYFKDKRRHNQIKEISYD